MPFDEKITDNTVELSAQNNLVYTVEHPQSFIFILFSTAFLKIY